MKLAVLSLFPDMFSALEHGITGRAQQRGLIECKFFNPRDYSYHRHRRVDDRPYGGGPGMVMSMAPMLQALQAAKVYLGKPSPVIYLSPQGARLDQNRVAKFAAQPQLILIAGRYEGIDERFISQYVTEECSIGDYVLSGGELAAMILIDAVTRLLPDALGDEESAKQDSFATGILDHPHYTRPEIFEGYAVPKVLTCGDHEAIRRWRLQQALGRTWLRRPDLLTQRSLTIEEQRLLNEFIEENHLQGKGAEHE